MTPDKSSETGLLPTEESRRSFLGKFSSAVFAGLVAPAVAGQVESAAAAPPAAPPGELTPVIDLPEAVDGEHPHQRMAEDLRRALQKPVDQRKWAMVIDLRKCVGCNGCTIACITENKLPPGMAYRPVMTETHGTYPHVARRFIPRPCMQCENPPCVPVCPVNATWKRSDGIISIDYDQCIGCRYCITACPYSARSFDAGYFYSDFEGGEPQPYELLSSPEYGEDRVRAEGGSPVGNARKCTFCLHRIEQGELPACVLTCMGWATYFGDMNDTKSLVAELIGQPNVMRLKEELGTDPKVFYLT
jgi:molybdopterin-containing oxidoreductase family iron-sulfur binding subunit